ncbi:glutamate ABC transporter substrate-binding protein [Bifidobacterium avesanii]|uniref:Transporter substrate-binding domain-containing protein n=1 Tax=Bifidobacterium avesanii TaxID=1798157 RepID=A0A7K3TJK8_9BIFI|nr:glutamate ABC transporter substrate-binding protein [Bifidobacterium avesanii]KAB8290951.1 ABC transporter substrate-binding protein [Bifidobacterium avesanii]NEG78909.1 transporter substrate-binding domain-containing protein [Bifidobacterium avesanii]
MTIAFKTSVFRKVAALVVASGLLFAAGCGEAPTATTSGSAGTTTNTDLDASAYDAIINAGDVADDATIEANAWAKSVKDAGVLKVGGTKTSQLFSLQSTTDNKVRGFDAGLSQLLARYILGDAKTDLTVVDSSTRESVLQNGTVNAVFATYSINDKRKEKISFAGPYYVSQQAILVKKDNTTITGTDSLNGKKVAVQAGSTGPQIVAGVAPQATVQEFQTDAEATQALSQGRVDAYVVDQTLQLGTLVKSPNDFKIAGEPFGNKDPYGIGLPKDSDAAAFVNAWLKKIEDDGTWAKLWKVTIGDRTGVTTVPTPPEIEQ